MNRKLKMGMVGGGRGAFIGGVHRRAANLDGQIELVAGPFPLIQKIKAFRRILSFPFRVMALPRDGEKRGSITSRRKVDFVVLLFRTTYILMLLKHLGRF